MRFFCFVFLLVVACAAGLLAYENQHDVTLTIFNKNVTAGVPVLVGLTYLAGMLSGWTVVGILRRSLTHVIDRPLPGEYANAR